MIRPIARLFSLARRTHQRLSRIEKIIILVCLGVVIVSSSLLKKEQGQSELTEEPAPGGSYTEGILLDNPAVLARHLDRLTKSGLVRFDENLVLQASLAQSWTIDKENNLYSFGLFEGVDPEKLKQTLQAQKNGLSNLEVTAEGQTLKIKPAKEIGALINKLTEPIFEIGPYNIISQEKDRVVLEANAGWPLGRPKIDKIVIYFFTDADKLVKKLKAKELQGVVNLAVEEPGFINYPIHLQRQQTLFFNLSLTKLQNKKLRQAIRDNTIYDSKIELKLAVHDQPDWLELAQSLKARLADKNIDILIEPYSVDELKDIIMARDYELLLYGLEIGRDPDIYLYYHSSQIPGPGQNLSQYFSLEVDRLLDEAHREIDPIQRKIKTDQAQARLDQDIPSIDLKQKDYAFAASSEIKNIRVGQGVEGSDRFNNVWEWYIKTKKVRK